MPSRGLRHYADSAPRRARKVNTMPNRITIYSGPSCAPCTVAKNRLTAAGVPFDEIDLSVDEEALARLKRTLDVPKVTTPVIHYAGEHHTIAGLTGIINAYKENS